MPDLDDVEVKRRAKRGPVVGFCLSGGGIRSATVALGALQTLREEFLKADYLVSVSGGGYTAGALQLSLTDVPPLPDPGERPARVIRDAKDAFMPGSVEEDRLRRHASYIADSTAQLVVALAVLARGLLLSFIVLFGPALVLGWLAGRGYDAVPLVKWDSKGIDPTRADETPEFPTVPAGTWWAIGAAVAAAAVGYIVMLLVAAYGRKPGEGTRKAAIAITGVTTFVIVVTVGVPAVVFVSSWLLQKAGAIGLAIGGSVGTLLISYIATIATFARRREVREKVGGLFSKRSKTPVAAVPTGALQLLLVLFALAALGVGWLLLFGGIAAVAGDTPWWVPRGVGMALVLLGGVLDQTFMSLHPFYRRRLARAFAMRRVLLDRQHTIADEYRYDELTKLSTYGKRPRAEPRLPQIIFAAAANLTGEQRAPLGAVSYTFTDEWVGGPDIGYVRTSQLDDEQGIVSSQLRRDLTVQAAVAISGAAVASAMGRQGRWYATLLAVTGARLGTWLPNPAFVIAWRGSALQGGNWWTIPALPRVRRLPYLVREVINKHSIQDRLLQVTDGGHYENLGLVELLRRRCTKIYCIDASGDSPPTAGTLASAITLAQAELGVTIELDDPWNLVPGSGNPFEPTNALSGLNSRVSRYAVVTGTITYPKESGLPCEPVTLRKGRLVVVKTLLTPDMDYDILAYAVRNGAFPHDTTGDQFFNDDKFCAYSALGRQLGTYAKNAMPKTSPGQTELRGW